MPSSGIRLLNASAIFQIVTAHAAAAVPQQAVFAVTTVMPLRPHQQQRAVGCAPADVDDQHALLLSAWLQNPAPPPPAHTGIPRRESRAVRGTLRIPAPAG